MFYFSCFYILSFCILFKVALYSVPCVACGILYLVSQLIYKKPKLHAITLKSVVISEDDDDDGEENYVDVKEDDAVDIVKDELEASITIKNLFI